MVWRDGVPVWAMNYHGLVLSPETAPAEVYLFLKQALPRPDKSLPLRGPKHHSAANMVYLNQVKGDLNRFQGRENIELDGESVYELRYHGGLIRA